MTEIDSVFDRADSASGTALSPVGAARRDRMLDDLKRDMRRVHVVRRRRRTLAAAAAPLVLVIIGGLLLRNVVPTANQPGPAPRPPSVAPAAVITIVHTTPPPPQQLITSGNVSIVQTLSDSELLEMLAAMNRPAGLVRAGDRTWLTRSVADL